jgi:hypothetical protein
VAGGTGAETGGNGRFLFGHNLSTSYAGTVTGAASQAATSPTASNPFVMGGPATPLVPDLVGGAEAFGLTNLSSSSPEFVAVRALAPENAIAALMRFDTGPTGYSDNFTGHDALILINLKDAPIAGAALGAGGDHMQGLLEGGFASNADFGGSGPTPLASLAANGVYLTLIPSSLMEVNLAGDGALIHATAFDNDSIVYLLPAPPILAGDFNVDGSVDAADYVVWRNGLDTVYTPADYGLWRANFGARRAAATAPSSIPEPATVLLFALGSSLRPARRWMTRRAASQP